MARHFGIYTSTLGAASKRAAEESSFIFLARIFFSIILIVSYRYVPVTFRYEKWSGFVVLAGPTHANTAIKQPRLSKLDVKNT